MDGVLVIDKPAGLTSHDVVARVRRALGIRRVGHLGTLDPMATGVLPLVVGRATRLASLLAPAQKTYDGIVQLGVVTDTYDATGTVATDIRDRMAGGDPAPPTADAVARAAEAFTGTFLQQPPPFSAKKVRGVRAYRLARRQRPVAPEPVTVTVHAIDILEVTPMRVRCRVTCDAGFYMRALAHDLGAALGCGACLTPHGTARARHGNDLTAADVVSSDREWTGTPLPADEALAWLYDADGALLAVARSNAARVLHPAIVLV